MLEELGNKQSSDGDVEMGKVYAGQEWPADVKEKYANSFSKVRPMLHGTSAAIQFPYHLYLVVL
jgi:hypothetical protein